MPESFDIAIIGAGAAGLMSAIWAGRTARSRGEKPRIIVLDGARTLGAKILVAGGGRCNVTHDVVDESAYAGSSRHAIRKVLLRFDVPRTVKFFRELGVELKREDIGKLFPMTDRARDVLDALLSAARDAGVEVRHPWRVEAIVRDGGSFLIIGPAQRREVDYHVDDESGSRRAQAPHGTESTAAPEHILATRVILATGGKSLPKTGSDGGGYALARALGHSLTDRVFPSLVPLTLPKDHFICGLSGLTLPASFQVRSGTGKKLVEFTNSTLCTHFGLSGPSVLDISRYYLDAKASDPGATLLINWLPGVTTESFDAVLRNGGRATPLSLLRERVPERMGEAICRHAGVIASTRADQLTRESRRRLVASAIEMPLPITGDRGFAYAEVTAGGVPLSEVRLETMESRACPGLHLCGEICDVDGRIGGYNFQWAWASGFVAGSAAALSPSQ